MHTLIKKHQEVNKNFDILMFHLVNSFVLVMLSEIYNLVWEDFFSMELINQDLLFKISENNSLILAL